MTLDNCVLVPVPADLFLERHRVLVAAIEEMQQMARVKDGDIEAQHSRADGVLCAVLRAYGAGELVDAFEAVEKWYA